jgi:hypothetical protein
MDHYQIEKSWADPDQFYIGKVNLGQVEFVGSGMIRLNLINLTVDPFNVKKK